MRKLLALLLVAMLVVSLFVGCGAKSETGDITSSTTQAESHNVDSGNEVTDEQQIIDENEDVREQEQTETLTESEMKVEEIDTSEYYDRLLCSGGGYYLVAKQVESVTDVTEFVGVLDEDYNWVVPLSDDTPFNPDGKIKKLNYYGSTDFDTRCSYLSSSIVYAGEDIFVLGQGQDYNYQFSGDFCYFSYGNDAMIYHVLTNTYVDIDVDYISLQSIWFTDGYYVASNHDVSDDKYVLIINSETGCQTTFTRIDSETGQELTYYLWSFGYKNLGRYSEGLFYAYDGFYDIDCNLVIDLSEYAGLITNQPYFTDGTCTLIAENEIGTQYEAIINIKGEYISEFTKIE